METQNQSQQIKICGECRYLAECSVKKGINYITPGCENWSRKRGRPATAVRQKISQPVGYVEPQPTVTQNPQPVIQPEPQPVIVSVPTTNVSSNDVFDARRQAEMMAKARIPEKNSSLVWTKQFSEMARTIKRCRAKHKPVCIQGHAGTGKDEILFAILAEAGKPTIRINCGGDYKSSTLLGRSAIINGKPGWQDGLLTVAFRFGYAVILDEGNCLGQDITMPLHGMLDEKKMTLPNNSETIFAHPDFEIYMTQNPLVYHGTKPQNQAWLDRFVFIDMKFDSEIDQAYLAKMQLSQEIKMAFYNFIQSVRQLFDKGQVSQNFGHRTIKHVSDLLAGNEEERFTLTESVRLAYLNKLCDSDRLALSQAWNDLVTEENPENAEKTTEKKG